MYTKLRYIFILIGLISIANVSAHDTITVYVKPQKNIADIKTFNKVLSQTNNKPLKIIVSKGIYTFDSSIEVKNPNTHIICEDGAVLNFKNNLESGFIINRDNCSIHNATINGNGKSSTNFYQGFGVLISGAQNTHIINCRFTNISGHAILLMPSRSNVGCRNSMIKGNKISKPSFNFSKTGDEAAILLGYAGNYYSHDNNIISNNEIDGGQILKIGIGFIGHGNDNIFEFNTVKNTKAYGIVTYEYQIVGNTMKRNIIRNNDISNIGEIGDNKTVKGMGIYLMTSVHAIIENNKVYNVLLNSDKSETLGAGAISVSLSPFCTVNNNNIDVSYMYGIVSDYSFNSSFTNNKISNVRKSGMYFINMNDVVVSGNSFTNIGEVSIKGYFENTSLPYIKEQLRDEIYKNINTGNNFKITGNTFNTDKQVLLFTGNLYKDNPKWNNKIKNNIFEKNKISRENKSQNIVDFKLAIPNTNIIRKNRLINTKK